MPTWCVARTDDATRLLRRNEARALSAFPQQGSTAPLQIARKLGLPIDSAQAIVDTLLEIGLVAPPGEVGSITLLQLTRAGGDHPQRDGSAAAADHAHLPVRSDRVRSVLDHLAQAGPTRTVSIGRRLGVELGSMNALMQYLKRKGLVRKAAGENIAPYELTETGRAVWAEMTQSRRGMETET
jgi:DNA-binding MarR family transcriptional regulator